MSPLGQRSPNLDLTANLCSNSPSIFSDSVSLSPASPAIVVPMPVESHPCAVEQQESTAAQQAPRFPSPSARQCKAEVLRIATMKRQSEEAPCEGTDEDTGLPSPSFSFDSPPESPLLPREHQSSQQSSPPAQPADCDSSDDEKLSVSVPPTMESLTASGSAAVGSPVPPANSPPLPAVTRWIHRSLKTAPEGSPGHCLLTFSKLIFLVDSVLLLPFSSVCTVVISPRSSVM